MPTLDIRDLVIEYSTGDYVVRPIDIVRELAGDAEDTLATLDQYEYFGELGAYLNLPRSATARANGAAVLKGYPVPMFTELAGGAPSPTSSGVRR